MKGKAVVLLSGGVDSSTCLGKAVEEFGCDNVYALNAYYGQKHKREIESARRVAAFYGVPYEEMDLSCVMKGCDCPLLEASGREIKHLSYAEQLQEKGGKGVVDTYVPFRNGLLLSCAVSYAMNKGASLVYYGAHADDAVGGAYPDCTPGFVSAMNQAVNEGTAGEVSLSAPFVTFNKSEVVKEGLRLKVPYGLTWSCYEGGDKPCGKCGTCRDRAAAFLANGVDDPASEEEADAED